MTLIGAALILWWRRLSEVSFRSLGLYKPKSIVKTIFFGVLIGLVIKFVFTSMVMPALGYTPGTTSTFGFLKGNVTNALLFSVYVILVGGFSEEVVFRGFLFNRYEKWIGASNVHKFLMVVIGSLIFGIPHFYQGGLGVIQSVLVGMIYGTMYLLNKKNLWMVCIAHAVFDLFAIYIIYNDLSAFFNQLFF